MNKIQIQTTVARDGSQHSTATYTNFLPDGCSLVQADNTITVTCQADCTEMHYLDLAGPMRDWHINRVRRNEETKRRNR